MTDPDPIAGHLGELICTGWISTAPDTGRDAAFLLLSTPDGRARQTMPAVAGALGLDPSGRTVTDPVTETRVRITGDGWVYLEGPPGADIARPVTAEWTRIARGDGRVVLVVGYEPMPSGVDPDTYTGRLMRTGRMALGLVPL